MVRKSEIDEKDIYILEKLRGNSRLSYIEISKELGISEGAVRKRVKKLLEKGIIKKFTTIIDYKKIGKVESLTGIDVLPEKLIYVLSKLKEIKEIKSIFLTSGDHNIIIDIIADSFENLEEIHKKIESLEGVQRVCPATIVEILK